jgi:MFS family permease
LPSPDPVAESVFQKQVRENLRRNYLAHLCHGLLGQTGMRLVNAPTLLPVYVEGLAGSAIAVGVARGLQFLGMFLSPVVAATAIEHRRRVLPVGFAMGAAMRVQVLGLALGGLLLPDTWALISAWAFLGLFGVFLGVQGVVFNFLVAKVIPVDKRGALLGLRNALAGLAAAGVAIYAGVALVESGALGNGFAATFLLAFCLTSVGLAMLLFVREPESPTVRERARLGQRLRELPALLRSDRAFTRYFVARALATIGRMAVPFYVLYADERIGISGEQLGILTGAFIFAQSSGNLIWGLLADLRGFRAIFLTSLSLWVLAVLLLMQTHAFSGLVAVFGVLGAGLGGFQMSAQNLVLEFGSRQNLPMRIAVANSASELVAATGAIAGGILAAALSYVAVFWIAIAFQLTALVIVAFWVDEPRRRGPRRADHAPTDLRS